MFVLSDHVLIPCLNFHSLLRSRAGSPVVWEPGKTLSVVSFQYLGPKYRNEAPVLMGFIQFNFSGTLQNSVASHLQMHGARNIRFLCVKSLDDEMSCDCQVTMEWWTHLWLNEGFATWIEYLCVDHTHPEYEIWTNFLSREYASAMSLDALASSHPIEVRIYSGTLI